MSALPPADLRPKPEAAPSDLERLLREVVPLLSAKSLDSALPGAIHLLASLAGSSVAALFLLKKGNVTGEHWHGGDGALRATLRPELVSAALRVRNDSEAPVATVGSGTERWVVRATPFGTSAELLGAVCFAFPEGHESGSSFEEIGIPGIAELFAEKVAASREVAGYRSEKARYERWFRTLDAQLRLLDRERQKFVAVVNQSDTYMLVVNTWYEVLWVNSAMSKRIVDTENPTRWIGRPLQDVWDELDLHGPPCGTNACPVAAAFGRNLVVHQEYHQLADQERRNLYLTAMPIKGPDGKPDEVLIMVQDLSDLEVLRRSETRYRQLFERSPDAMIMVEPSSGRIVLANPVASRLTGYSSRELLDLRVETLHDPDDWSRAGTVYSGVFSKDDSIGAECVLVTKEGDRIIANMSATRFDLDGQAVVLCEFQDITDQRRLESELRHSQKMEAIGRLAGGVAHDFNNILTIIMGQSEMLLGYLPPEDRTRRIVESVQKAAVRGSLLTRQLLAFSRKEVVKHEALDLNEVLRGIESMLRTLIGEDVELVTLKDPEPCPIRADRGQIEQIIMNLAVNARDAMPQGGKLWIEVSRAERPLKDPEGKSGPAVPCVRLLVRDDGMGMDAGTRTRLFEPFFTTKEQGKGTGLGLSSAYGIVQEAGGDIDVVSALGRGTTFHIYIPLAPGKVEYPEPKNRSTADYCRGTESILLVEDEDEVRALATEVLEMSGYTVVSAASGEEALQYAASDELPIELVLTDVIMPGMSGGELVQHMSTVRPRARVLYMSGYNDDDIVRHGVSDSNVAFLQKPFTLEALTSKVRDVLDRPRPDPE